MRVILWIILIKLLVSLSIKENDKRLKPTWIRSLSVIRILACLNNLDLSLIGNLSLVSLFKF